MLADPFLIALQCKIILLCPYWGAIWKVGWRLMSLRVGHRPTISWPLLFSRALKGRDKSSPISAVFPWVKFEVYLTWRSKYIFIGKVSIYSLAGEVYLLWRALRPLLSPGVAWKKVSRLYGCRLAYYRVRPKKALKKVRKIFGSYVLQHYFCTRFREGKWHGRLATATVREEKKKKTSEKVWQFRKTPYLCGHVPRGSDKKKRSLREFSYRLK